AVPSASGAPRPRPRLCRADARARASAVLQRDTAARRGRRSSPPTAPPPPRRQDRALRRRRPLRARARSPPARELRDPDAHAPARTQSPPRIPARRKNDCVTVDEIIDQLYGLPLGEFTAARNEAAAELSGDEAKRVKALRKPTGAAAAVNRLVRDHR